MKSEFTPRGKKEVPVDENGIPDDQPEKQAVTKLMAEMGALFEGKPVETVMSALEIMLLQTCGYLVQTDSSGAAEAHILRLAKLLEAGAMSDIEAAKEVLGLKQEEGLEIH
ncbi:MAG: hypothetical protein DRQ89_14665 [Epsilonproteobacteria bacterium]|nr:MAG: hypothetical protein DRQ89_14665 [Campylobacterota bacterium]